jgi:ubiquinone/menaquinone biosynthesis C-methylase UbiE
VRDIPFRSELSAKANEENKGVFRKHDTSRWTDYFNNYHLLYYFTSYSPLLANVVLHTPWKGSVLDVGVGCGWSSIALSDLQYDVVGIDVDQEILNFVGSQQERFDIRFPLRKADMCDIPFPDNSFHTVFCQGVLLFYDEETIRKALLEFTRVSRLIVIVDVPSEKSEDEIEAYGGERYLSWKKWGKMIESVGLTVIKKYGWGVPKKYWKLRYLLPYGLWKRIEYRVSFNVGFICKIDRSQEGEFWRHRLWELDQ